VTRQTCQVGPLQSVEDTMKRPEKLESCWNGCMNMLNKELNKTHLWEMKTLSCDSGEGECERDSMMA
jgi:hypothetical protein